MHCFDEIREIAQNLERPPSLLDTAQSHLVFSVSQCRTPDLEVEKEIRPLDGGGKKNDGFTYLTTEIVLGPLQLFGCFSAANRSNCLRGALRAL